MPGKEIPSTSTGARSEPREGVRGAVSGRAVVHAPIGAPSDDDAQTPTQSLRTVLSRVLWLGTLCAAAVMGVGVVLMLVQSTPEGAASGDAGGTTLGVRIASAGVVMLVALPAVRVLASLLLFARSREWLFVVLSAVVLAMLGAGLMGLELAG